MEELITEIKQVSKVIILVLSILYIICISPNKYDTYKRALEQLRELRTYNFISLLRSRAIFDKIDVHEINTYNKYVKEAVLKSKYLASEKHIYLTPSDSLYLNSPIFVDVPTSKSTLEDYNKFICNPDIYMLTLPVCDWSSEEENIFYDIASKISDNYPYIGGVDIYKIIFEPLNADIIYNDENSVEESSIYKKTDSSYIQGKITVYYESSSRPEMVPIAFKTVCGFRKINAKNCFAAPFLKQMHSGYNHKSMAIFSHLNDIWYEIYNKTIDDAITYVQSSMLSKSNEKINLIGLEIPSDVVNKVSPILILLLLVYFLRNLSEYRRLLDGDSSATAKPWILFFSGKITRYSVYIFVFIFPIVPLSVLLTRASGGADKIVLIFTILLSCICTYKIICEILQINNINDYRLNVIMKGKIVDIE